jgi:hypothetical protein
MSTIFEVDGRYATISPSSKLKTGSTSTQLFLAKSQSRAEETNEKGKWDQYIDQEIMVRSPDWNVVGHSKILALNPINDALDIHPPLPFTLQPGYIVESPRYDDSSAASMSFWKRVHAYINPMVKVVALISPKILEVSAQDIEKFWVGSVLSVHTPDFSSISKEVTVKEIDHGSHRITVSADLSYTVGPNDHIELIGFKDKGMPYRII